MKANITEFDPGVPRLSCARSLGKMSEHDGKNQPCGKHATALNTLHNCMPETGLETDNFCGYQH